MFQLCFVEGYSGERARQILHVLPWKTGFTYVSWSFEAVARETSYFTFLTSTICKEILDLVNPGWEIAIATCWTLLLVRMPEVLVY